MAQFEDSQAISRYTAEVRSYEPLTREDEVQYARVWHERS